MPFYASLQFEGLKTTHYPLELVSERQTFSYFPGALTLTLLNTTQPPERPQSEWLFEADNPEVIDEWWRSLYDSSTLFTSGEDPSDADDKVEKGTGIQFKIGAEFTRYRPDRHGYRGHLDPMSTLKTATLKSGSLRATPVGDTGLTFRNPARVDLVSGGL